MLLLWCLFVFVWSLTAMVFINWHCMEKNKSKKNKQINKASGFITTWEWVLFSGSTLEVSWRHQTLALVWTQTHAKNALVTRILNYLTTLMNPKVLPGDQFNISLPKKTKTNNKYRLPPWALSEYAAKGLPAVEYERWKGLVSCN